MAKISGPMFSLDARGKFAGALVFSNWKGRPTVRQLVQPANPMSPDQVSARNKVRAFGAIQHFVNANGALTVKKYRDGASSTDKDLLIGVAPSGQAWNGNLVKVAVGAGGANWALADTAWSGVNDKAGWSSAANALSPAIPEVAQYLEDNVSDTPMASGEVYYRYVYALYLLGLSALKDETPPTWA